MKAAFDATSKRGRLEPSPFAFRNRWPTATPASPGTSTYTYRR